MTRRNILFWKDVIFREAYAVLLPGAATQETLHLETMGSGQSNCKGLLQAMIAYLPRVEYLGVRRARWGVGAKERAWGGF